jgi:hypothetical protein
MRVRLRYAGNLEESLLHVVVREDGDVGRLADPVRSHRAAPRVCVDELRHVAPELANLADGVGAVAVEPIPLTVAHDDRCGKEPGELLRAAVGAHRRPAAAFRSPERLVEHVHARRTRARAP